MIAGRWGILDHPVVVTLARIATGVVLLVAALAKIGDLASFSLQVHNYHLLPIAAENVVAATLPWIELLTGLALVLSVRPRSGALVAFVLMLVFTFAVGAAWARGLDFECGCFGKAIASTIGAKKFFENVGLLLVSLIAMRPRGGPVSQPVSGTTAYGSAESTAT